MRDPVRDPARDPLPDTLPDTLAGTLPNLALAPHPVTRAATLLAPRALWIAVIGLAFIALAGVGVAGAGGRVAKGAMALPAVISGLTLLALAVTVEVLSWRHRRRRTAWRAAVAPALARDRSPVIIADADGQVSYCNEAARARFDLSQGGAMAGVLADLFAAPASAFYRLQHRALTRGAAFEDLVQRAGHLRLSVHRAGPAEFVWRLEDFGTSETLRQPGETIGLAMMRISKTGTILSMNEALRRLLGGRETTLDRVITDLPLRPGEVHRIAAAQGAQKALVVEIPVPAGGRELYLVPEPGKMRIGANEWGVVEGLPVPLLRLDHSGRVTMANQRARRLLATDGAASGAEASAPEGAHFSDLVEGLGRPVSDWLREAWNGRNLGRTETLRASRVPERFVQVSLERYDDEDGPSLVAVLNDATELKSLETQFVQSQKMQAIGELAGGVAHDFNNLLTAITGHCDLMQLRHPDQGDPDFADLNQISQNANRAAALVGQLLAFSRKQTLRMELVELDEMMRDLTHLLGRLVGERVRLDLSLSPEVMAVRTDKRQLEQVLMNLVVNARDAMLPEGGEIRILVENFRLDRPLKRDRAVVPPGDYVTIRVVDEGSGIAPEHLEKVFEPFFTTKRTGQGTGLGLSMVYGIVKQSGGFIFVDSVIGSGTTFTLYLPVYAKDQAASPEPVPDRSPQPAASAEAAKQDQPATPGAARPDMPTPTHAPQASEGGIVLLVEDEAPVRAFAARALRLRGYTVLEAENAEEALRILDDDNLNVDIFVTDVIMPGMDGPTWVAEALQRRPGVRVVFVSGYAEDAMSEHQARIPNSVFLPKPFSLAELTATVSQQLH